MYSSYGESWTHPIVLGGMVAGYMEAWAMSGLLDVREVVLDDNIEIEEFLALKTPTEELKFFLPLLQILILQSRLLNQSIQLKILRSDCWVLQKKV